MEKKIFISHSYQDRRIVDALVEFLVRAGVKEDLILSTSTPGTQISTGAPLYSELRNALDGDEVLAILLLSDNYYSSVVCMNEMGAIWVKDIPFQYLVLPGFSFEKIKGVIRQNERVGISLSPINRMTNERFYEFKEMLEGRLHITVPGNTWERARDDFYEKVRQYEKNPLQGENAGTEVALDMRNVQSFCIGDLENDGCRILRKESSSCKVTSVIDFEQTSAKLCSVVFFAVQSDWSVYFGTNKRICFDIYADSQTFPVEIEVHFANRNVAFSILVDNDANSYDIPLTQFTTSISDWKQVKEVSFLFRRKNVGYKTTIVIENLRLS